MDTQNEFNRYIDDPTCILLKQQKTQTDTLTVTFRLWFGFLMMDIIVFTRCFFLY